MPKRPPKRPKDATFNRNPSGKNQHQPRSQDEQEKIDDMLRTLHREKVDSNKKISQRIKNDLDIKISESGVKRRRKTLRLSGSRSEEIKNINPAQAEQMVVDELSKDPAGRMGVHTIQARVAFHSNTHLPRNLVSDIMHTHAPEAFDGREPTAKKIMRVEKIPLGIHHRWAGDGHDKLNKIGFPVWAVVDDGTSKWLGGWVVPSNRLGVVIGYLFLLLVEKYGGIPPQFTTDCGSETTVLRGLIMALREIFFPESPLEELPAHRYLRSVHHVSIERSWLRLRLDFGDNAVVFFNQGIDAGIYDPEQPRQKELCEWLWAKLLNQELQQFMKFRNGVRMRLQREKPGQSGRSRNEAFSSWREWGDNFLMKIPEDKLPIIQELKAALGGDELLMFTSVAFDRKAQEAYDSLKIEKLTMQNVWDIFTAMYNVLYPNRTV